MPVTRALGLPLLALSMSLITLEQEPARSSSAVTAQPSMLVEETSWSPLGNGMAAVDFAMSLSGVPGLRAIEVRVQAPADPSLHLEVTPRAPSPEAMLFPVKTMGTDGTRLFALVFPQTEAAGADAGLIGTLRCDTPMEAVGPSMSAVGLMTDGSRTEIPVEYSSTSGRQNQAPPVSQRLFLSPNPTSGNVEFQYALELTGSIDLSVYDLSGRKVASVDAGIRSSGDHRIQWNGRDNAGHEVAAGIYFVKLRSGAGITSERLSVVR